MRTAGAWIIVSVLGLGACTSDEWPPLDHDDDDDDTTSDATSEPPPEDTGDFDGAHLEVFEPQGASIHFIGEPLPLQAELRGPSDLPVEWGEIFWIADEVDYTLFKGTDGEIDLPPGIYDISAVTELPNGDRLESEVGDVRVQSRWTGRYQGRASLALQVEFQGFPFSPICSGPLRMTVDFDGESIEIEPGQCTIDVILTSFEADYEIDAQVQSGIMTGTIHYAFAGGLFELEIDFTGAFIENGFGSGFSGEVSIPLVGTADANGTLSADLVTPYI